MEHLGTSEERRLRGSGLSAPAVPLKEAGSPRESDSLVQRQEAALPGCGESEVHHLEASVLKGLEVVSAGFPVPSALPGDPGAMGRGVQMWGGAGHLW